MKRRLKPSALDSGRYRRCCSQRQGAVAMIMVIAVTIIGTILLTQGVRSVLNERRAIPAAFEQQQVLQLLQTAVQKLKALPAIDDVQAGEWAFPAGTLHANQSAKISVTIDQGSVVISATYPLESDTPVTVSEILTTDDWADSSATE